MRIDIDPVFADVADEMAGLIGLSVGRVEPGAWVRVTRASPTWKSAPSGMAHSDDMSIDLWVPMEIAVADTYPLWEWGSPRRYRWISPPMASPRGWPVFRHDSWQEEFFALACHEARHLWQFRQKDRPRYIEMDAERYAFAELERLRESLAVA